MTKYTQSLWKVPVNLTMGVFDPEWVTFPHFIFKLCTSMYVLPLHVPDNVKHYRAIYVYIPMCRNDDSMYRLVGATDYCCWLGTLTLILWAVSPCHRYCIPRYNVHTDIYS